MKMQSKVLVIVFVTLANSVLGQQPELLLPVGHTSGINSAVFSPYGKIAASASVDKTAKIWDITSGTVLSTLTGHAFDVNTIVFSPDGRTLLTSGDTTAILWDAATGKSIQRFTGHTSLVNSASFSPDGRKIITSSNDGTAIVWDISSGGIDLTLKNDSAWITVSMFSPDGKTIVTSPGDNTLKLWDAGNGQLRNTLYKGTESGMAAWADSLGGHRGMINSAAFSPDGKYIATASDDKTVKIWTPGNGEIFKTLIGHEDAVYSAAYSHDGKFLITASGDNTAKLWNATDGILIHTFAGHSDRVKSAAFSSDGERIITASWDNTIRIWNTKNMKLMQVLTGHTSSVASADVELNGRYFVTGAWDNTARIWDTKNGKIVRTLKGHTGPLWSARFSHAGNKIVTASSDSSAKIWDAQSGKLLQSLSGKREEISSSSLTDSIESNKLLLSISDTITDKSSEAALEKLWEALADNMSNNYELDLKRRTSINGHNGRVNSSDFSPEGKFVVTASDDCTAMIWDADSGTLLFTLRDTLPVYSQSNNFVFDAAFSPDGKWVAAATRDGDARIWDANSGKLLHTLTGHTFFVNKAVFSPDGKYLITVSMDKSARIWNTESYSLMHTLSGNSWNIYDAVFSPDSKNVLTFSDENKARLWDVNSGMNISSLKIPGVFLDMNWKDTTMILHNNSRISFQKLNSDKELYSFIAIDTEDWLVVVPENYYMCTKNAANKLTWRVGDQLFTFDQFDLQFNRPDIILEKLGNPDTALIQMYRKAYQKRLRKAGFTEKMFSAEWHTPEMKIMNSDQIARSTDSPVIQLQLCGTDSKYNLDRFNILVNDVPIYGINGIPVRGLRTDSLLKTISVPLSAGYNKIQASCINEKGAESLKKSVDIVYDPALAVKPDLYLIALSVSEYKDKRYDLQYAVKDGRDISGTIDSLARSAGSYGKIIIDTLFNNGATRSNFFSLRDKLLNSGVDDEVIVFVSGHGLLNRDMDFYFAAYDIDFNHPEKKGISFDDLESILDGIPARKKLLMMDACHSGELDKEETTGLYASNEVSESDIAFRGSVREYSFKGINSKAAQTGMSLNTSFELMQEMFAGLDKGTGTTVISAAAGKGYALESPQWNNGVFTYSIINGLKNKAADKNGDGVITISELKDYSIKQVELLTGGKQKPTARRESINYDWRIW